jgi:hypothetical protein
MFLSGKSGNGTRRPKILERFYKKLLRFKQWRDDTSPVASLGNRVVRLALTTRRSSLHFTEELHFNLICSNPNGTHQVFQTRRLTIPSND